MNFQAQPTISHSIPNTVTENAILTKPVTANNSHVNAKKFLLVRTIIIIMFKDPVCGMMVDENKAQHISEVAGKKVYLCSAGCKNRFEENQKKYGY